MSDDEKSKKKSGVLVNECYYFGCQGEPGHYFWTSDGTRQYSRAEQIVGPNIYPRIDGGFCPNASEDRMKPWRRTGPEVEGEAALHFVDGWTIISFWDRSVDKRGACNSNFIVRGVHSFKEVLRIARENFPQVLDRLKFEIKLVEKPCVIPPGTS